MNSTTEWLSLLQANCDEIGKVLMSRWEFDAAIAELLKDSHSPLRGLQFSLDFAPPFSHFDVGRALSGEPESRQYPLDDSRQGQCRVRWWRGSSGVVTFDINDALFELFKAWWKPALRTPSAGLPDLKRHTDAVRMADESVNRRLVAGEHPAVLSCDLDNFKSVNDISLLEGDRVIKEFGALAESAIAKYGVLLHNGGDELVVLCPGGSVGAIRAAYAIRQAVSGHDFNVPPLAIGMSAGIAGTDSPQRMMAFQELLEEANDALKNYAKKPKKGSARFNPHKGPTATNDWPALDLAALGKCLVLSAAEDAAPFGNAWLNALSAVVAETLSAHGWNGVAPVTLDFTNWMNAVDALTPNPLGRPPKFLPASVGTDPTATALSIGFAIAHGALFGDRKDRLAQSLTLSYTATGRAAMVDLPDGTLLWQSLPVEEYSEKCELRLPPRLMPEDVDAPLSVPRAILIKTDHSDLSVSAHLFGEIIVVDDRPTRGGCLPDFWEVTISRLVTAVHSDPNICAVFVIGEHRYAAETIDRLRNLRIWQNEAEDIAPRLAVGLASLRDAAKRLDGQIHFPGDYQELVRELSKVLDSAPPLKARRVGIPISRPILDRQLQLGSRRLRDTDGCRVGTIEEAFPSVLEIMRNADVGAIRDQAGQLLKELVDFKVHLLRPEQGMIPDYYRSQTDRMERYFDSAFLDETQFFGKALRFDNQLENVLRHVSGIIQQEDEAFATRRAILIVPNHSDPGDWSPLGLVSVRMIPRFSDLRCELSFSFTWRTVEALVGFPYSLYGSVRFSQSLTSLVLKRLPSRMLGRLSLGYVSYLAHSLHMFTDEFGQAIVRRIVNDATR